MKPVLGMVAVAVLVLAAVVVGATLQTKPTSDSTKVANAEPVAGYGVLGWPIGATFTPSVTANFTGLSFHLRAHLAGDIVNVPVVVRVACESRTVYDTSAIAITVQVYTASWYTIGVFQGWTGDGKLVAGESCTWSLSTTDATAPNKVDVGLRVTGPPFVPAYVVWGVPYTPPQPSPPGPAPPPPTGPVTGSTTPTAPDEEPLDPVYIAIGVVVAIVGVIVLVLAVVRK